MEINLDKVRGFSKPKEKLEQYLTPIPIVKHIIEVIADDVNGQTVLDIGAGTGILGIAALQAGASHVTFIEKDEDAVRILEENLQDYDKYTIINEELRFTDVQADVCIMNPPFGTRNAHADRDFLDYALSHTKLVASLHKTSTMDMIRRHITDLGAQILHEEKLNYTLERTLEHHKRDKQAIAVTLVIAKII